MVLTNKIAFAILATSSVFAQSAARPEFEVASIKPAAPTGDERVNVGLHIDGSQVHCASWALRDYVGMAYKMKAIRILGPDWIKSDRYDIAASLPAGSNESQVPEMFQSLLADRFHLKVHTEKREFPVYVLLPGKGSLKMKESSPDSGADKDEPKGTVSVAAAGSREGVGVNLGQGSSYTFANNKFDAKKLTMEQFASNLERFADRQILDMTGLTGRYDFTINLTPEDYRVMLIRAGISAGVQVPPQALKYLEAASSDGALGDALQQIGLRFESRKAPLDVLVIDDALRSPTSN
jgi:uncharacterized protein (TIGR03435 family)